MAGSGPSASTGDVAADNGLGGDATPANEVLSEALADADAPAAVGAETAPPDGPPFEVTPTDTTAPSVQFKNLFNGTKVSGTFTVEVDAKDDKGVASVQFLLNNKPVGTVTSSPYSWVWDTTAFAAGNLFVTAIAVDAAGNKSEPAEVEVIVANEQPKCANPPSVVLVKPADGAYVFGNVALEADPSSSCSGASIGEVLFSLDGSSVGKSSGSPWKSTWDSDATSEGPHSLKTTAKDSFDNLGVHQITVNVDRTDPTVSFVSPKQGVAVNGDVAPVTVAVDAQDNLNLASVAFSIVGEGALGTVKQKPYQVPWPTAGFKSGNVTLKAVATDAAGHTKEATRTVTLDRAPKVYFDSPNAGVTVAGKVTFQVQASDDLGFGGSGVLKIDGTPHGAKWQANKSDTIASLTYEWDTPQAVFGDHELTAVVGDIGGNTATATITVKVDQPLAVTVGLCKATWQNCVAPKADPQTEFAGKLYLQVDAKDDNADAKAMQLQVDGKTVEALTKAPWQFTWDSASVKDGAHELAVKVTTTLPETKALAFGLVVNNCDLDKDGHLLVGGSCGGDDCDDKVATTFAGAKDTVGNGVDDNCDGLDGVDVDGDKAPSIQSGGKDCDDANKFAYPCADELTGDATDANCDGKLAPSCDDCSTCSVDSLVAGKCVHAPMSDGAGCDDGDGCTTGEVCTKALCGSGKAKDCNDSNVCTADACNAVGGCVNSTLNGGCDLDGTACTPDACLAGACKGGAAVNCDDKVACTTDACDAKTGKCGNVDKGDGAVCDDGDLCTGGDACSKGNCTGVSNVCGVTEVCAAGVCKGPPSGMVLIPAGKFTMGCVPGDKLCYSEEKPQHEVFLDAFYIDVYEVTVAAFKKCVDAGQCTKPNSCSTYGVPEKPEYPINCLTWSQADSYCTWVAPNGRLPTEAEWEKAARGGLKDKKFPWGDEAPTCAAGAPNAAVWGDGAQTDGCGQGTTWAVGTGSGKNGYGLHDMSGNVWEWVNDWYAFNYQLSPASNPQGPASGAYRVRRGGGFKGDYDYILRASSRDNQSSNDLTWDTGFRCARSLP